MEVGEEGKKKVELIQEALHQLMEERRKEEEEGMHQDEQGDEETILISKLLSKLDTLEKDDGAAHLPKESSGNEEPLPSAPREGRDCENREVGMDEIVRELRRVKRQNLITHCLLAVMIAVTAFWQFSEVSLLLAVKERFSHPFRAVGDVIQGTLKGRGKKPAIEAPPLPPIGVPDLPHANLPSITLNGSEE